MIPPLESFTTRPVAENEAAHRSQVYDGELPVRKSEGYKQPATVGEIKVVVLDPKQTLNDPISRIINAKWRYRQQHGRLTYELMLQHPAVRAPFELVMACVKSAEWNFESPVNDPSEKQKEMADFLNSQINRLPSTGEARDGWTKLIDGFFGQGFEFGFSLAEMAVAIDNWRGRSMRQIQEIRVMPQASLDNGFVPREDLNELLQSDTTYRCFDFGARGEITGVHQFRNYSMIVDKSTGLPIMVEREGDSVVSWRGPELLRILHFTHNGGDGNPMGESLLYPAFQSWADLHIRERQEQVFLDANGEPFITAVQEVKDGVPNPNFGAEVVSIITNKSAFRILTGTNAKFGSVAASNPDFTKHIKQNKDELRTYISQGLLCPEVAFSKAEGDSVDVRDMLSVFLKFRLPALFKEIEEFMTWKFGRRIIDANYSNVDTTEYPRFKMRLHLDNDLRVAGPLLQVLLRYMDSDRLGDMAQTLVPGVRKEWFPKDHANSVEMKRPLADTMGKLDEELDSKNNAPDQTGKKGEKQEGGDGSKVTTGQKVNTEA